MDFQKLSIVISMFLIFSIGLFGQKKTTEYLPANLNLSPNGKFINSFKNSAVDAVSDNGIYRAKYVIGQVSDEMREILNFRLYKNEELLYTLKKLPGSDVYISNSGFVAAMDMQLHFQQQLKIHLFSLDGNIKFEHTFSYASLFGFSPSGKFFVVGTDKHLNIFSTFNNKTWQLARSSKFAFSENEDYLVTAFEQDLVVYHDFNKVNSFNTGLVYPRDVIILPKENTAAVIGKQQLKIYNLESNLLLNEFELEDHCSYRDLTVNNNTILAGIQYKNNGTLKGILHVIGPEGEITANEVLAEKKYHTFEGTKRQLKSTTTYDPIPWPFFPFDEVHKVWNHYEQHMGNGTGDYSYLHQGLDIEVPDNEPTYAIAGGWVKLVLTLGGDIYWRVAVAPEQVSDYSDGWLYAHLVPTSIAVDVGDYVEIHEYLGDIIHWSADWGHIHFVNIHDQGNVWNYDDDEWGINFNPLLALTPLNDDVAPVIEDFSSSSKFGFCENETSNYLSADNLQGAVDIIAKISDYHAGSEWEQPAYLTYYWITTASGIDTIVHKTLGQILNHSYEMYNGGYYEPYAYCLYKKDDAHPSPPWMDWDRDYWQILTNNDGDSIIDPNETNLSLVTPDFADGEYKLFVEAWDEAGNMAIDSQNVVFANYVDIDKNPATHSMDLYCYPNPAKEYVNIEFENSAIAGTTLTVHDVNGQICFIKELSGNNCRIDTGIWGAGIYYISVKTNKQLIKCGKIMVID